MGRTIISRTDIQAAIWEGAAQRAGLTLSAWARATLDAEASSTSPSYLDAFVEHELEPVGRAAAAALTDEMHADGSLPADAHVAFDTTPIFGIVRDSVLIDRPLPGERAFRGPDPKPTAKPKKERRR